MTHQELFETWYRRVWVEEDATAIDELFVPEGQALGLGGQPLVGPEDFKGFHQSFLGLVGKVDVVVDHVVSEGEWCVALITLTTTREGSDVKATTTGTCYAKVVDNKMVEAHNHVDFMGLFEQLGLLPENALAECLSGSRVG